TDMYDALQRIQRERTQWRGFAADGLVPEVPLGLADLHVAWQRVAAELDQLDASLSRKVRLTDLPVEQLVRTLAGLAAKSDVFDNLVERAELRGRLSEWGLEPLLTDLSTRHVDESRVADELEFAWWQSLLEHALQE